MIDYDEIILVFVKHVANGQFASPSRATYSIHEKGSASTFHSMEDDINFHVDNTMEDFSMMDNQAESCLNSGESWKKR